MVPAVDDISAAAALTLKNRSSGPDLKRQRRGKRLRQQ
jgi:hypothetical protein